MSLYVSVSPSVNPYFNLSLEEYFLLESPPASGSMYLVFYENFRSIILGRSLNKAEEIYEHKRHSPVIRRGSGGGSVVHFYGNLNYALILNLSDYPELQSVKKSYEAILDAVVRAFGGFATPAGISDIAISQLGALRKISGNAQLRKRKRLLHHGTIIYNTRNISDISFCLRSPPQEPDYRGKRAHDDFLIRSAPIKSRSILMGNIANELSSVFCQPVVRRAISKSDQRGAFTVMQEYISRSQG